MSATKDMSLDDRILWEEFVRTIIFPAMAESVAQFERRENFFFVDYVEHP
jgi:hypothetical protein